VEQAPNKFVADPAARVTAPALRRRRPGSTAQGRHARDRVLQASVDLITEVGIDQVRLAKVAQRAGMSTGQVMYYFTSKEHILLEALAWREHEDTRRRRASLRKIDSAWRQRGAQQGVFEPPDAIDDFTIRFCALLDGLGIFHLRQMPNLPRHRVTGLAMDAARAELTAATRAPSPSSAAHAQGEGIVS